MDNLPNRLSTVIDTTSDKDAAITVYQLGDENSLEFCIPFVDLGIGHVIRKELLDLPTVVFAGVKPPHPLEPKILIRVKSVPGPAGEREQARPVRALWQAIQNARARIDDIGAAFALARDTFDIEHGRAQPTEAADTAVQRQDYGAPSYGRGEGEAGSGDRDDSREPGSAGGPGGSGSLGGLGETDYTGEEAFYDF